MEGVSFSGNERNNLMLSARAEQFEDVSGISGFDHPADGRGLALLDYDRDGWVDLAVVNANAPSLQLFRNRIGELYRGEKPRKMLALRFVGSNRSASPDPERSNRNGYGAVVEVDLGDVTFVREHRAGEGFSTQNSQTLLVGLGSEAEHADLKVRWPSGREQSLSQVPADVVVTAYEDAAESPDGSGFRVEGYRLQGLAAKARAKAREDTPRQLALARNGAGASSARLKVFTTMATWCDTCKGELPQVELLRSHFSPDDLDLVGIPVDEHDSARKLAAYREEFEPAYRLLDPLPEAERAAVQKLVIDELRVDVLPATIVTDSQGRVLYSGQALPSVSQLEALL